MESRKAKILDAFTKFVRQRPGLEYGNYGDLRSYRAESRSISRDLQHATELIAQVGLRDSLSADAIIAACRGAYSGRLEITETVDGIRIDYCTGQYFSTEYRRAVCAVLAAALWDYWREDMPAPVAKRTQHGTELDLYALGSRKVTVCDYLRGRAQAQLSRGVANRYFR